MRSGGKWNSSTVRVEGAFAPAIAVVEMDERAGDDDSELLLISSPLPFSPLYFLALSWKIFSPLQFQETYMQSDKTIGFKLQNLKIS